MNSWLVVKKAGLATWPILRGHVMGFLLWLVGAIVYVFVVNWGQWVDVFIETLSFGFIPVLMVGFLVFLWNLWLAPYRLSYENSSRDSLGDPRKPKIPDYDAWDAVDPIGVIQASYLWSEMEPMHNIPTGNEGAYYSMIKNSIKNGEIKGLERGAEIDSINLALGNLNFHSIEVHRNSLIDLANIKKLKPKFLFPEER